MKTALLAQNEALEAKTLNPDVKKSMLPLSHTVQYPVDVDGAILPCCCVEVVPSDSYRISNEILLRQLQPLKVPQMTRYTLNTAYFYCSNRLGYKKWEQFFDRAHEGRAGINYSFDLPRVANHFDNYYGTDPDNKNYFSLLDVGPSSEQSGFRGHNQSYKNTLHTYFDISMNRIMSSKPSFQNRIDDGDECPLAFPFFDYQMIVRDFYTNIDRLPDNPSSNASDYNDFDNPFADWAFSNLFPVDDDEIKLKDGVDISSGFHTGDDPEDTKSVGFILDKVRYHDFRPDYFNSSKRAPMRGEAPSIDTTVAVGSVDATDVIGKFYGASKHSLDFVGVNDESSSVHPEDKERLYAGHLGQEGNILASQTATTNLKNSLEKLKINLETTKSINAAELILMTQLTLWQTLNMLAKPTYNDFLRAHFDGVHVGDSLAEKPQYIGGTSTVIDVNEVLQTSASDSSSDLGTQGAVAHALSSSYVGQFFANDQGFIIGIMYIIPDIVYRPAMPRWASRRTVEDFYFPEFANLSMQATLNKEIFFSNDDEWNNQPLGYVGAYDELRSIPNYVAGEMLDSTKTDLKKWVVMREFTNSNKPAINQRFLSCKGNVDKSAWSAPNEPKFIICTNIAKRLIIPFIII